MSENKQAEAFRVITDVIDGQEAFNKPQDTSYVGLSIVTLEMRAEEVN